MPEPIYVRTKRTQQPNPCQKRSIKRGVGLRPSRKPVAPMCMHRSNTDACIAWSTSLASSVLAIKLPMGCIYLFIGRARLKYYVEHDFKPLVLIFIAIAYILIKLSNLETQKAQIKDMQNIMGTMLHMWESYGN